MRRQTDEVQDESAIGEPPRRTMEVGQPPGRLADGGIGVGVDEVACVLKRVAEAEHGRKAAAVCVVDVQ